jgi:hypothetical protein
MCRWRNGWKRWNCSRCIQAKWNRRRQLCLDERVTSAPRISIVNRRHWNNIRRDHKVIVSQTSKIICSIAAPVLLTPVGILLTVVGTHSSDLYAYMGAALLLPSFLISHVSHSVSIPGLTTISPFRLFIFVAVQVGYFYAVISAAALIIRGVRMRARSSPKP